MISSISFVNNHNLTTKKNVYKFVLRTLPKLSIHNVTGSYKIIYN